MGGFANGDNEHTRKPGEVDCGIWQDEAGAFERKLAFHCRSNVDGLECLERDLPRNLLRGAHLDRLGRATF
jgi:hypothetical protein